MTIVTSPLDPGLSEPALQFVPLREIWFVSAFVHRAGLDPYAKAQELAAVLERELREHTAEQLHRISWDPALVARALAMLRTITLRGAWNPYVDGFPYHDENTDQPFDELGWFEFEVEYFADAPTQRRSIDPILVQQAPVYAAERLIKLAALKVHRALRLDIISPIYVMVVSDTVLPAAPPWTAEHIRQHRRAIGAWTDAYSGAWPDYTDELYVRRVAGNLSNRLSELHFLGKNSGLLWLASDNMRRFFDSYMRPSVLAPTAQLRAMHFAMYSINESLDILLMRQARDDFFDLTQVERKLAELQQLRSALQMKMSQIYNELDSNKRQHYSAVLRHLLGEFNLEPTGILARIGAKFDTLQAGLHQLYQRRDAAQQERTARRLGTLGTLFSLGVLADFASLLLGTTGNLAAGETFPLLINGTFTVILLVAFLWVIHNRISLRRETAPAPPLHAADAIVLDAAGRVLVITRKNPPFRGQRGFPGTFVPRGAEPSEALRREVKDETNLDILVDRKLGRFDAPGRDPRGRVVADAYLCRLAPGPYTLRCREDAGQAAFVPRDELRGEDLAFDHEDMLAALDAPTR